VIVPTALRGSGEGPNYSVGVAVGLLVGVGPEEPLPVSVPDDDVSVGVAEPLEVSVGVPDDVGVEVSVGVDDVVDVGVEVPVGVEVSVVVEVPVGVDVGVDVGLEPVVVGLGLPDGVTDGQADAVAE
jgi:hypothetical protein